MILAVFITFVAGVAAGALVMYAFKAAGPDWADDPVVEAEDSGSGLPEYSDPYCPPEKTRRKTMWD